VLILSKLGSGKAFLIPSCQIYGLNFMGRIIQFTWKNICFNLKLSNLWANIV